MAPGEEQKMTPKVYGITLVPRRLYNLILVGLFAFIINLLCINGVGESTIMSRVNDMYGSPNVECVVEAVYFEARGEPVEGWKATTEVIVNRSKMDRYPDTLCEVVQQNKQFSYRNGKNKEQLKYNNPMKVHEIAQTVYQHLYDLEKNPKKRVLPECVSHYDGKAFKKPYWAKKMKMVKEVGAHQFYCLL